jgi:hypothetical protein
MSPLTWCTNSTIHCLSQAPHHNRHISRTADTDEIIR